MWSGFTGDLIRRANQRSLILALALLAGLTLFFGYNRGYFSGFFAGPHTISTRQLAQAFSLRGIGNPFVRVEIPSTQLTNLVERKRDDGEATAHIAARFLGTDINGRILLIRVAPDVAAPAAVQEDPNASMPGGTFIGYLRATPASRAANARTYGFESDLLPLYLDTYEYKSFGYVSLVITLPLLALSLWLLWRYFQVSGDPARHPLVRKLSNYGQMELLLQQLDVEMSAPHFMVKRRGQALHITEHWLLATTTFGGAAVPIKDLVWIYRRVVKRKIYMFITVGKTHLLLSFDRFGRKISSQLTEAQTADVFNRLRTVTPQAVSGYDKRLQALWRRTANKAGFPEEARMLTAGQILPDQQISNNYRV